MGKVRFLRARGFLRAWIPALLAAVLLIAGAGAATVGRHLAGAVKRASKPRTAVKTVQWTGTWAAAPQKPVGDPPSFDDVTLRLIVHATIGGEATRIRLSNAFGTRPVEIGAATVGLQARGAAVKLGTLRTLTFNHGQAGVTIPPGGQVISDGTGENVPADANLAVSLYLPRETDALTQHAGGGSSHQVSYVSRTGDHSGDRRGGPFPKATEKWFYLSGVDVQAPGTSAVVTLGDSITDGTNSTDNANHRYPDWLADRLRAAGGPYSRLSVLNAGIGGDELLQESACCAHNVAALDRLDTDVLDQSGVKDVIVMLGTNDILGGHHAPAPAIIAGLKQLIAEAHARGIRVFGGTITPSSAFTPAENRTRAAVNRWITSGGAFDGVVDFARAVADPADPARLAPAYSSYDHLHPDDAGYRAMAGAVNLADLLGGTAPATAPRAGRQHSA